MLQPSHVLLFQAHADTSACVLQNFSTFLSLLFKAQVFSFRSVFIMCRLDCLSLTLFSVLASRRLETLLLNG